MIRAGGAGKARRAGWVGVLLFAASVSLRAHGDEIHSINSPQALSPWDLAVLAGLLLLGTLYVSGTLRLRSRATRPASPALPARLAQWEPCAFAVG